MSTSGRQPEGRAFVRLGPADLPEGSVRSHEAGERIVLVSRIDGRWHAIDDWCNHAGCLLSGGRREGRMIVCPCHEAGFDLASGANLNAPDMCGDQEAFEIEERGGELWVRL